MKKLLLSVAAIAALLGVCYVGAVAIDNHYQNYQNKQAPAEPVITQREADKNVAAVKSAAVADKRAQVEKFNGQVAECQKGKAAYDLLTAYQKARVAAPVCATPEPVQSTPNQ
jgi:hypothetical protein